MDLVPLITGPSQPVAAGRTITNTVTVQNAGSSASSGTVTVHAYAPVSGGSYSGAGLAGSAPPRACAPPTPRYPPEAPCRRSPSPAPPPPPTPPGWVRARPPRPI